MLQEDNVLPLRRVCEMDAEKNSTTGQISFFTQGDRILAVSGYLLIGASVFSFFVAGYINFVSRFRVIPYASWLDFVSSQLPFLSMLLIGIVTALLGKRLLTSSQSAFARTIPTEDLPLVR